MTGTREVMIFSTIERVESSSPPGVRELDDDGVVVLALRLIDRAADELVADRMNRVVDVRPQHAGVNLDGGGGE